MFKGSMQMPCCVCLSVVGLLSTCIGGSDSADVENITEYLGIRALISSPSRPLDYLAHPGEVQADALGDFLKIRGQIFDLYPNPKN